MASRIVSPMIRSALHGAAGRGRRVAVYAISLPALVGLVIAPGVLLVPMVVVRASSAVPTRLVALGVTLLLLALVAAVVARNAAVHRRGTGELSIDHGLVLCGCVLWSVAAVLLATVGVGRA
jgi:uncharacterized membrane protein